MILFNDTVKVGSSDVKMILTKPPRPAVLTTPLTGVKIERDDFIFFAIGNSSELYLGAKKTFQHYNLDRTQPPHSELRRLIPTLKEYPETYRFCNDVKKHHLQAQPEAATMELLINIEQPNPASSFAEPRRFLENSVNPYKLDKQIKCKVCNSFLTNEEPIICLLNRTCPRCIPNYPPEIPMYNKGFLAKRKDCAHYQHFDGIPSSNLSDYYKLYKKADMIADEFSIPKKEYQTVVLGLGSAGTNILDQLIRFREMKQFILLDFDIVERKNLRNQLYTDCHVGASKVQACRNLIQQLSDKELHYIDDRYSSRYFQYYKAKYTILGFDSIKIRLEVFEDILAGKLETQYIVDIRYNDLEASIYFIDTSNPKQMKYYHQTLLDDMENLAVPEEDKVTEEEVLEIYRKHEGGCYAITRELGLPSSDTFCSGINSVDGFRCGSHKCINLLTEQANNYERRQTENTCTRWDIIDIYKFASSYITAAVRQIEQNNPQPFIHVEVCTDPMPAAMALPINNILKETTNV